MLNNPTSRSVRDARTLKLYFLPFIVQLIKCFFTRNTKILFHKANLQKSIRFIFTCEKSLYSQSEWRSAVSRVEV